MGNKRRVYGAVPPSHIAVVVVHCEGGEVKRKVKGDAEAADANANAKASGGKEWGLVRRERRDKSLRVGVFGSK